MSSEVSRGVIGYSFIHTCPNRSADGSYACASALGELACVHLTECLAMRGDSKHTKADRMKQCRKWHEADLAAGIVHVERNI